MCLDGRPDIQISLLGGHAAAAIKQDAQYVYYRHNPTIGTLSNFKLDCASIPWLTQNGAIHGDLRVFDPIIAHMAKELVKIQRSDKLAARASRIQSNHLADRTTPE
jgi:hypothetical protein